MSCTICNRFQGKYKFASIAESHEGRGNRNHIVPRFTWDELQISAKSCYCCSILGSGCRGCFDLHGIKRSDILHGSLHFSYPSHAEEADEADTNKNLTFFLADGRWFEVELFATEDDDCPIPDSWDLIPISSRTSPRTDSTTALVTIKSWISSCVVTHCTPISLCDSPELPYLPTRVVDVGLDDGVIKLIETKGAMGKYVCLSHCWGLTHVITTTTSTLEARMKGIAWEDLSKTFQDAIALTRTLGFRWIWVDSLCIIQDSASDWSIESAKMASVYSNGHLTIAATHSANGHGGLYSRTEDVEVSGKTPDGEDYCLYFREKIDHHIEMIPAEMKDVALMVNPTATYYPLLSRAWVYQERMLSTRVLHFGRYEMFLECRSSIQCECGSIRFNGSGSAQPVALIKIEYADKLSDYGTDFERQNHTEVHYQGARLWRTMVCSYTALLLTKSKDRLPAISGLARQMAARRKSKYLAGLWEETLSDDLLWVIYTTSKQKKPRPYPRNAPTWSWASVETYVSYWDEILFTDVNTVYEEKRPPHTHYSTIEKCQVNGSAIDEFGLMDHGLLKISGLVAEGVLERDVEIHDDVERIVHYISFPSSRLAMKSDYLLDPDGPGQTSPTTPVFCLRMSLIQQGRSDFLVSLVLKRSLEVHGSFERIGTLLISGSIGSVDSRAGVFQTAESRTVVII